MSRDYHSKFCNMAKKHTKGKTYKKKIRKKNNTATTLYVNKVWLLLLHQLPLYQLLLYSY